MEALPNVFQYPYAVLQAQGGCPLKGHWHAEVFKNERPIVLELGCGRGEYTVGLGIHAACYLSPILPAALVIVVDRHHIRTVAETDLAVYDNLPPLADAILVKPQLAAVLGTFLRQTLLVVMHDVLVGHEEDRKSTRLNSSHVQSRMPSSA